MANTNQQKTWFSINNESARQTEKSRGRKVACPLFAFLFFVVLIFVYGALNYSGFCFKEMRYLSDEEKIRIARDSIIIEQTSPGMRCDIIGPNKKEAVREIIPYKNADEFIRENPDWFQVLVPRDGCFADDPAPTILDRVRGSYSYGIRVTYVEKRVETQKNKNGSKGKGQRRDIRINGFLTYGNCGQPCKSCFD
jgi:hypothetical protein